MPHHGDAAGGLGPRLFAPDAHGGRGRAVDRHGSVHRPPAHVPEHRRRDFFSFRPTRRERADRQRPEHHLQDSLQRPCFNDGGTGRRRRATRAAAYQEAGIRRRAAHHRSDRGFEALPVRRSGVERRASRPRGVGAHPGRAGSGKGRHRDDLRPGVHGRSPPQAVAREICRAGEAPDDSRGGLRGLRRLRPTGQLHEPESSGNGAGTEDAHPPVVL